MCLPFLHRWPFNFHKYEIDGRCDLSTEVEFIGHFLGIYFIIFGIWELYQYYHLFSDMGIGQGRHEILKQVAEIQELDGDKRLEATETMLKKYGRLKTVAKRNVEKSMV